MSSATFLRIICNEYLSYLKKLYTIKCYYNAAQFIAILPMALQWQQQNLHQSQNSQQTPHTSPSRMSYGVSIMKKIYEENLPCYNGTELYVDGSWHKRQNSIINAQHYSEVIMGMMASQITSLMIVYSAVYSGRNQRKQQSSASLAFVRGIHRWPVNSPHKGPVIQKMFPFDDIIMNYIKLSPGSWKSETHIMYTRNEKLWIKKMIN